jgi:hypothetical protein
MSSTERSNEPGILLGIVLITILCALLAGSLYFGVESGPGRPGAGSVLLGLYVMTWGIMFLASYYFSYKTFFLRGLIWVCEHLSAPAGRKMAFFYFALAFFLGGAGLLAGLGII